MGSAPQRSKSTRYAHIDVYLALGEVLCQYLDTMGARARGSLKRRLLSVAGLALLAVTALAGVIQAGIVAPQFRTIGGAGIGDATFASIENDSWRSWTITGLHLSASASTRARVAGRVVVLSLHEGPIPPDGRVGPPLRHLEVGPGQQFNLRLSNSRSVCRMPGRPPGSLESLAPPPEIGIFTVIEVATPFGARDLEYEFAISRC